MKKTISLKFVGVITGIVIGVACMVGAFLFIQNSGARASESAPQDVKTIKITGNSATVQFTTGEAVQGLLEYGTNPRELRTIVPDITANTVHNMNLTGLNPGTTYYYHYSVGETVYDNDGVPWMFSTKKDGSAPAATLPTTATTPANDPNALLSQQPTQPPAKPQVTLVIGTCPPTNNCAEIQKMMGKGCTSSDYVVCLKKNGSSSAATPTPEVAGANTQTLQTNPNISYGEAPEFISWQEAKELLTSCHVKGVVSGDVNDYTMDLNDGREMRGIAEPADLEATIKNLSCAPKPSYRRI